MIDLEIDERNEHDRAVNQFLLDIYPSGEREAALFHQYHPLDSFPETWREPCMDKLRGIFNSYEMIPVFNNSCCLESILHINNVNHLVDDDSLQLTPLQEELRNNVLESKSFICLPQSFFLTESQRKELKERIANLDVNSVEYFSILSETFLPVFKKLSTDYDLLIEEKTIFFLNLMGLNANKITDFSQTVNAHDKLFLSPNNAEDLSEDFFTNLSHNYKTFFEAKELDEIPRSLIVETILNAAISPFATDRYFNAYRQMIAMIGTDELTVLPRKEFQANLNYSLAENFMMKARRITAQNEDLVWNQRLNYTYDLVFVWLWKNINSPQNQNFFKESFETYKKLPNATEPIGRIDFLKNILPNATDLRLERDFFINFGNFLSVFKDKNPPGDFLDFYFAIDNLAPYTKTVLTDRGFYLTRELSGESSYFNILVRPEVDFKNYLRFDILYLHHQQAYFFKIFPEKYTNETLRDITLQSLNSFLNEYALCSSEHNGVITTLDLVSSSPSDLFTSPENLKTAKQIILDNPFVLGEYLDALGLSRKQKVNIMKEIQEILGKS